MTTTTETACPHDWTEMTLREPTFQIAFATLRTCRLCGRRQGADHTAGRIGGPWVDLKLETCWWCENDIDEQEDCVIERGEPMHRVCRDAYLRHRELERQADQEADQ